MQSNSLQCDTCALQDNCGNLTKAATSNSKCDEYIEGCKTVAPKRLTQAEEIHKFYSVGVADLQSKIQEALKNAM